MKTTNPELVLFPLPPASISLFLNISKAAAVVLGLLAAFIIKTQIFQINFSKFWKLLDVGETLVFEIVSKFFKLLCLSSSERLAFSF